MTGTKEAKALRVIDSSTTEEAQERTHEIVVKGEVIAVTFKYGEETILPFEQGIKFMKDGFIVQEVDGSKLNLPAVASDNVAAQLAPDECIAKYSELTFSALKLRAAQKHDGEVFLDADEEDREDIVNFLIGDNATITGSDEDAIEVDVSDKTEIEKQQEFVVAHFGEGRENIILKQFDEREDGVVIFAVADTGEDGNLFNVIVQGTGLELYEAALQGVSADRFNSDQDAKKPDVEPVGDEDVADILAEEGTEGQAHDHPPAPEGANAHGIGPDVGNGANPDYQPPAEPNSPDGENGQAEGNEAESGATQPDATASDEGEAKFTLEEIESSTDEALALAVEHGIDINDVEGTGADGNVLKGDVETYIEKKFPKTETEEGTAEDAAPETE